MSDYSQKIWNFLISKGFNKNGTAGIMGNLYAESLLQPKNLQDSYNRSLGLSDDEYTNRVDNGTYTNFVNDSAGYGLCQWTYFSRKKELLAYAKQKGTSIGDVTMQLEFLIKELNGYGSLLNSLKNASSVAEASNLFMVKFENPLDKSNSAQAKRASFGQTYYNRFAGQTTETTTDDTDSSSISTLLKKGDSGEEVKSLQEKLIKLGYTCGSSGADGDFGMNTWNAVIKFQREHNLDVDGIVGPATLAALNKAIESSSTTTVTVTTQTYTSMLKKGDAGEEVKSLQEKLIKLGYSCGSAGADGDFGSATRAAVILFQQNNGLDSDGIAGPATLTAIDKAIQSGKTNTTVTPSTSYSDVKMGYAAKDENGAYRNGEAGDQTQAEVKIGNWYNFGQNVILRPKNSAVAEKIASACEKACNNNHIGYDQAQRNTLYTEALKVNMDLSKITTDCECDCASLVCVCAIAGGVPAGYLYIGGNMQATPTIKTKCLSSGYFIALTDSKYLNQKNYLKRGDIILNESAHVTICLQDGIYAETTSSNSDDSNYITIEVTANVLNIRSGPGTNYSIEGTCLKGSQYKLYDTSNGWGKIDAGWISLEYVKEV